MIKKNNENANWILTILGIDPRTWVINIKICSSWNRSIGKYLAEDIKPSTSTQKHNKVFSRVDFYTLFAVRKMLIRSVSTFFPAAIDLRRPKSKPCKFSRRPVSHQQKLTFGLLFKHQSFLWHFHQLHLTSISETAPDIATVLLKPLTEPTIDFFRINNQTASVGYRGPEAFRTACHIPNLEQVSIVWYGIVGTW